MLSDRNDEWGKLLRRMVRALVKGRGVRLTADEARTALEWLRDITPDGDADGSGYGRDIRRAFRDAGADPKEYGMGYINEDDLNEWRITDAGRKALEDGDG